MMPAAALIFVLAFATTAIAEPLAAPGDLRLRHDLQLDALRESEGSAKHHDKHRQKRNAQQRHFTFRVVNQCDLQWMKPVTSDVDCPEISSATWP